MEIVKKHLVFLWRQNGPESYQVMEEVIETKQGYYFTKSNSGYFQITKEEFEGSLKVTLEIMPGLKVEYSQPRKRK